MLLRSIRSIGFDPLTWLLKNLINLSNTTKVRQHKPYYLIVAESNKK